jgi:signal transduction histidine kinase
MVETFRLESVVLFLGQGPQGAHLLTAAGPRSDEVAGEIYPQRASQIRDSGGSDLLDLRWESDSLLVMALKSPGRQIGFAILGPKAAGEVFLEEEKRLALTVGPLLAMAVDQSILSTELRELNQRLVGAQEMERKRMAADIHDGPLQKAIVLTRPREEASLEQDGLAKELVSELREVCSRLRPSIIDDLGLYSALEWLLDGVSNRTELLTSLSLIGMDEDDRFDPDGELTLFRITQESINNTLKHANATRIDVSLSRSADELVLMVVDDGVGFSPSPHRAGGAATLESGGVGLSGMRERVIPINGSLEISSSPGKGTTVMVRIPALQAQSLVEVEA